jgi:hypothetical protein
MSIYINGTYNIYKNNIHTANYPLARPVDPFLDQLTLLNPGYHTYARLLGGVIGTRGPGFN